MGLILLTDLMATERNFQEVASQFESDRDVPLQQQKWKSSSPAKAASENDSPCFECNICLDSAHDPVVTLCGHLFCWPCIYKWIHVQSSSLESEHQPQCPVCKANISDSSLVPLYGRGASTPDSEAKKPQLGLVIPRRPASGLHTLITSPTSSPSHPDQQYHPNPLQSEFQSLHHQQYFPDPYGSFAYMPSSLLDGFPSFASPTIGMFGEMVYARMFGSSETSLYAYPITTPVIGSTSPRIRRQEMQLHKSLNRVSTFFLCCILLCLILF